MTTKLSSENPQITSATNELEIFDTRDLYLSQHKSQRLESVAVGVDDDCIEGD